MGYSYDNDDGSMYAKPVYWGPGNNYAPRKISDTEGEARGINDGSYAVGWTFYITNTAFLWDPVTELVRELAGNSKVHSINIHGVAAGYVEGIADTHAYLFELNKDPVRIDDYNYSWAVGINDSSQVAGYERSVRTGWVAHACWWYKQDQSWVWQDLDPGGKESEARAINNDGEVTGYYTNPSSYIRGFIWDKYKGRREISPLGGESSEGLGINRAGQVVGTAKDEYGNSRAFIWEEGQGTVDLNERIKKTQPPAWYLMAAQGINDKGEIAGFGSKYYGPDTYKVRGFLLKQKKALDSAVGAVQLLLDK